MVLISDLVISGRMMPLVMYAIEIVLPCNQRVESQSLERGARKEKNEADEMTLAWSPPPKCVDLC